MASACKRVWFLLTPRIGVVSFSGPWEVFCHANDLLGRVAYRLEARGPSAPVLCTKYGLSISGVRPLPARCPNPPDMVVVPGASSASEGLEERRQVIEWLKRYHPQIPTIVSTCAGAFILGEAGLLDGRRAMTHWMLQDDLRARFPAVHVVDEGIYTNDRGVWTSAGVTAGIDLALALVEQDHGHPLAMEVAKRMVLFLRRSGNQAQFSPALRRQSREPSKLRDISTFVLDHIDEPLPVERIAAQVGMSPRTLTRWCQEHLQESPGQLVRKLRVDEAKRLLEETTMSVKDICARTGLTDASTMWRVFMAELGVTPMEYRQRFAAGVALGA